MSDRVTIPTATWEKCKRLLKKAASIDLPWMAPQSAKDAQAECKALVEEIKDIQED